MAFRIGASEKGTSSVINARVPASITAGFQISSFMGGYAPCESTYVYGLQQRYQSGRRCMNDLYRSCDGDSHDVALHLFPTPRSHARSYSYH